VIENRGVQSLYGVEPPVAELFFPRAEQLLDAKRGQAWDRWIKSLFTGAKIQVQGETIPER